jgi:hypothetical protein
MRKPPPLTDLQKAQILGDDVQKQLAFADFRQQSPQQLTSLWDMIQFAGREIADALDAVKAFRDRADKAVAQFGPAAVMSEDEAAECEALNEKVWGLSVRLQLHRTTDICVIVDCSLTGTTFFRNAPIERRYSILENYFKDMSIAVEDELKGRKFICVPPDKARLWEQEHLLGPKVTAAASDELNIEIRAAGHCMAVDLNTAIFHLMRIVECGIRALAPQIGVTMSKRKISQAAWSVLIESMEARIRESKHPQKGATTKPLKPGQLKFFRGLLLNINCFKDLWRNDVMHMRGDYDGNEANKVKDHVKAFMALLESNGVPLK